MQLLKPHLFTIHIKVQICTAECISIKSLSSLGQSLSVWYYRVKSFVRTHQLWQLWGQGRWRQMRSVVVRCLPQFPAALLVSCHLFACGTDHISQLSIMLWKTMQKTLSCFFGSCDDILNQFFPLALSRLTIGHLQKKINRNLQVPAKVWGLIRHMVRNVDCHGGSQAWG